MIQERLKKTNEIRKSIQMSKVSSLLTVQLYYLYLFGSFHRTTAHLETSQHLNTNGFKLIYRKMHIITVSCTYFIVYCLFLSFFLSFNSNCLILFFGCTEHANDKRVSLCLCQENTDREVAESVVFFSALLRRVERSQAELLKLLEEKQKAAERRGEELIRDLETEVAKLKCKDSELERLIHSKDYFYLLQVSAPLEEAEVRTQQFFFSLFFFSPHPPPSQIKTTNK